MRIVLWRTKYLNARCISAYPSRYFNLCSQLPYIADPEKYFSGSTSDSQATQHSSAQDDVFFQMGRSPIEFTNARNEADGNIYPESASPFGGTPYQLWPDTVTA